MNYMYKLNNKNIIQFILSTIYLLENVFTLESQKGKLSKKL